MPEIDPIGPSLTAQPDYIDPLPVRTDPTLALAMYTAEAERVNRWINIGFVGLIKAIGEKETQTKDYETKLTEWYVACKAIIAAQDAEITEAEEPKRRILGLF